MGAKPTHPELLDWLATEFIAHGWSQKAIHRLIVTSAVYRQSSRQEGLSSREKGIRTTICWHDSRVCAWEAEIAP